MIDMAGVIATALADDNDVAAALTIYTDVIPEAATYPLCLVRTMSVDQAVPPVDVWDRYDVQLDIIAGPDNSGVDSIGLVRSKVLALSGVVGSAGIAGVVPASTVRTVDDSVSPARLRWVLTVEVTARTV